MNKKGLIVTMAIILAAIMSVCGTYYLINKDTIVPGVIQETEKSKAVNNNDVIKETETTIHIQAKIAADIESYITDDAKATIEYPVIKNMRNTEMQDKVNEIIKSNALSIIELYPINTKTQTASIKSEINYLDSNRISILYKGNVGDEKVFFSNTIDLNTGHNIPFNEYLAPQAMANLLANSKEEFLDANDATTKELRKYIKNNYTKKKLLEMFDEADFKDNKNTYWPKIFSYEKNDSIYFAIKVSKKLGNYAIIKYDLETK